MKKLILVTVCLLISGCSTPVSMMKNESGQVVRCGGNITSSLAGGMVGYYFQKKADDKCKEDYKKSGFKDQ